MSLFNNLYSGLFSRFSNGIKNIFSTKNRIDQSLLDELEELLISTDIGNKTSKLIIDKLAHATFEKEVQYDAIRDQLVREVEAILNPVTQPLILNNRPHIIMMCGVNGNGKTTTAGKLACKYRKMNKSVMLVACDTFRAAANEQLSIWAERSGCFIVTGEHGADSASVAYKAVDQAIKENMDVVIIDTAGRLQNNVNLMEELSKISRVIKKLDDTAPHDIILVLDATTGQNAYSQLDTFNKIVNITGLIITKLDGTAKGGVVVGLAHEYNIKLYAIGIGENIEDLRECTSREFAEAMFY